MTASAAAPAANSSNSDCRLTLDTLLVAKETVLQTPSSSHGIKRSAERLLRAHACSTIQSASVLLNLPQEASATAQIIFQRFYYQKSFLSDDYVISVMASLIISSKVEEQIRKIRDVINVVRFLNCKQKNEEYTFIDLDAYKTLKQKVIRQELRILSALGYNVRVNNPHKTIFIYLQLLNLHSQLDLVQSAWNYMNDALRSPTIFPCHRPEMVACACICLAARNQFIPLPVEPHWFTLFGACPEEIFEIVQGIIGVYQCKLTCETVSDAQAHIAALKAKNLAQKTQSPETSTSKKNSPIVSPGGHQQDKWKRNSSSSNVEDKNAASHHGSKSKRSGDHDRRHPLRNDSRDHRDGRRNDSDHHYRHRDSRNGDRDSGKYHNSQREDKQDRDYSSRHSKYSTSNSINRKYDSRDDGNYKRSRDRNDKYRNRSRDYKERDDYDDYYNKEKDSRNYDRDKSPRRNGRRSSPVDRHHRNDRPKSHVKNGSSKPDDKHDKYKIIWGDK